MRNCIKTPFTENIIINNKGPYNYILKPIFIIELILNNQKATLFGHFQPSCGT